MNYMGPPDVLFIKDVFIKDCIDDNIFENKLLESITDETNEEQIYDKIPSVFTGVENWSRNNLLCWNCHLNFDTVPIFIPKSIEPNISSNIKTITVKGNFCSYMCAYSYILSRTRNIQEQIENINNLNYIYKMLTGNPAPESIKIIDFTQMERYGGEKTLAQFLRSKKKHIKFNMSK